MLSCQEVTSDAKETAGFVRPMRMRPLSVLRVCTLSVSPFACSVSLSARFNLRSLKRRPSRKSILVVVKEINEELKICATAALRIHACIIKYTCAAYMASHAQARMAWMLKLGLRCRTTEASICVHETTVDLDL